MIDPTIAVHTGRVVKRTGDGTLVEFRSVVDAGALRDCLPIRFANLLRSGKSAMELPEGPQQLDYREYDVDPFFPTLKDQEKAKDIITNGWDDIVGVKVRCLPHEEYLGPMSVNSSMAREG